MARFRGSNWKKSRRLGISLSGTGKELEKTSLRTRTTWSKPT